MYVNTICVLRAEGEVSLQVSILTYVHSHAIEHSQLKIVVKSHQLICACNHISLHSVGHPIERHHSTRSGHPIERRHVPHAHPHMKCYSAVCINGCRVQQEKNKAVPLAPQARYEITSADQDDSTSEISRLHSEKIDEHWTSPRWRI